jgi:transglutaminase-like putative cysteine protease
MNYQITHTTVYSYSAPASLCHNLVHLSPRDTPRQICQAHQMLIEPAPTVSSKRLDFFGNHATYFSIQQPHEQLTVRAVSDIALTPTSALKPDASPPWESVRDKLVNDRAAPLLDAYQFTFDSTYVKRSPQLAAYALASFPAGRPLLDAVLDLTRRIYSDFQYDQQATTIGTPILEVLERRRGVCQDFSHLEIGCLRSLGLAARYVSGYLFTNPRPNQVCLRGADASHAWLSIYCPEFGWVDVDPTNNVIPSDEHLLLAWGRDYDDVSPVKGVIHGGGQHSVSVAVEVVRMPV